MRRLATTFALALCLIGCTSEVDLLTGGHESCSVGGTAPMGIVGVLVADPQAGTAIRVDPDMAVQWGHEIAGSTLPVKWPPGFTGRQLHSGEVEVLTAAGVVVITTGRRVALNTQFMGRAYAAVYPACDATAL